MLRCCPIFALIFTPIATNPHFMKKRVLVTLTCLFFGVCTFTMHAQKYVQGAYFDNSNVQSTKKMHFEIAGDKLSLSGVTQDTALHTQTIAVTLLNPDYSIFKYMTKTVSESVMINMHEGGIQVVENVESGKPVYYFVYNCNLGEDWATGNRAVMVREDGIETGFGYCSWMGFKLVNIDGLHKMVADRQQVDTIHFNNQNGIGWYTYQFGTTAVFDVKTGALEHAFPRGTTVSSIEKVNGSIKYFTTNDYYKRSLDPNDTWGKVYDATKATHYNADFSPWITSTIVPTAFNVSGYDVYESSMFTPIVAGSTLYFIHQITYKNDNYQYLSKSYLTDSDGAAITTVNKWVYNKWHFGTDESASIKFLPTLGKYAVVDYTTVYSLPELDSIGSFNSVVAQPNGSIKFVRFNAPNALIYNDNFSLYKTVQVADTLTSFTAASSNLVENNSKIELFFKQDSSLVVYNEDGKVLFNQGFRPMGNGPFSSGLPIGFFVNGEKYGRFSQTTGYQNVRTMPLNVSIVGGATSSRQVRLYRKEGDFLRVCADAISSAGTAKFDAPEGLLYPRVMGNADFLSTYFTNGLLWEEANPILFTTDKDTAVEVVCKPAPASLSLTDIGRVSGKIRHIGLAIRESHKLEVYLKNASTGQVVAQIADVDSMYAFNNIPNGTYQVLVNEPGFVMESAATVVLNQNNTVLSNIDFEASNSTRKINALISIGISPLVVKSGLYPNPAKTSVTVLNARPNAKAQVVDLSGKVVLESEMSNTTLNLSSLKAGVYFVRTSAYGLSINEKLIKE